MVLLDKPSIGGAPGDYPKQLFGDLKDEARGGRGHFFAIAFAIFCHTQGEVLFSPSNRYIHEATLFFDVVTFLMGKNVIFKGNEKCSFKFKPFGAMKGHHIYSVLCKAFCPFGELIFSQECITQKIL